MTDCKWPNRLLIPGSFSPTPVNRSPQPSRRQLFLNRVSNEIKKVPQKQSTDTAADEKMTFLEFLRREARATANLQPVKEPASRRLQTSTSSCTLTGGLSQARIATLVTADGNKRPIFHI